MALRCREVRLRCLAIEYHLAPRMEVSCEVSHWSESAHKVCSGVEQFIDIEAPRSRRTFIFALGAMTQLMRWNRDASIAGWKLFPTPMRCPRGRPRISGRSGKASDLIMKPNTYIATLRSNTGRVLDLLDCLIGKWSVRWTKIVMLL
jgi:hypothetical protein